MISGYFGKFLIDWPANSHRNVMGKREGVRQRQCLPGNRIKGCIGQQMGNAETHLEAAGQRVDCHTAGLRAQRLRLLQMLFVEGNHFCPGCEKSGNCQLQHQAERAGMTDLHYEPLHPERPVDASHPDVLFEPNRCILCQLCVRASDELDGKQVFAIGGHGIATHLLINSDSGRLGDSALAVTDRAAHICPVGALLPKRVGFAVPIGQRTFDDAETRG